MKATLNLFSPPISCSFSVCLNIPQGFFSWFQCALSWIVFNVCWSRWLLAAQIFALCVSAFSSIKTKCWHCSLTKHIVHGTEQQFSISDCLWAHPRRKGEPGLLSSCFSESSNIWSAGWAAGMPQRKGIRRGVRSAQLQRCPCSRVWGQRNNETPHKAAHFDLCWAALRFCFFWQELGGPGTMLVSRFWKLVLPLMSNSMHYQKPRQM